MTRNDVKREAAEAIIDCLMEGYEGYLCDLHNEVFNMGYYVNSNREAREWVDEYEDDDAFGLIAEVVEYEQDHFGEVNTDLSSAAKIVNMMWYIIGEEVLCELMDGDADCDLLWNEWLEDNDRKLLIKIFSERMAELY